MTCNGAAIYGLHILVAKNDHWWAHPQFHQAIRHPAFCNQAFHVWSEVIAKEEYLTIGIFTDTISLNSGHCWGTKLTLFVKLKRECSLDALTLQPDVPITLDVLHLVFSAFGTVNKIATFEKQAGLQALVQFEDTPTAEAASLPPLFITLWNSQPN